MCRMKIDQEDKLPPLFLRPAANLPVVTRYAARSTNCFATATLLCEPEVWHFPTVDAPLLFGTGIISFAGAPILAEDTINKLYV